MTHVEAQAIGAMERYLLNEMSSEEQIRFEEHYFACPECAGDVRVSTIFLNNLNAVLRKPHVVARDEGTATIITGRRRWVAPFAAAAVVILVTTLGVQNLVEIPRLRRQAELANEIESPPIYYISETRSSTDVVTVPPTARSVSLILDNIPGKTYPYYECELKGDTANIHQVFRIRITPERDEWQIRLPTAGLPAQRYTLKVRGGLNESTAANTEVAEYHFRLDHRKGEHN